MPIPIRALGQKPLVTPVPPGFCLVTRLPGFAAFPISLHARIQAVHRHPSRISLVKISMPLGGAAGPLSQRPVPASCVWGRKHSDSGRDPTTFRDSKAVNCSFLEYSSLKEIGMDKTTKSVTIQYTEGLPQIADPAGPEDAASEEASLPEGEFRTEVFPSASQGSATFSAGRCAEKGCVYPALRTDSNFCIHHRRQEMEPELYRSWQPTWLVIHRSTSPDGSVGSCRRAHDRFRLAAQSRAFQQGRI